jgi:arylsulfatase A-like enzyme
MKRFVLLIHIAVTFFCLSGTSVLFVDVLHADGTRDDFNIVLITIDTLRADHLSCYGYERPTSPHIDGLAEKGIIFKNAIAPSSWTSPSMASLFTSVYPVNHGVIRDTMSSLKANEKEAISGELITLAEILKKCGYTTFGVASNLHLQGKFGYGRGFDYFKCLQNWSPAPLVNKALYVWEDTIRKSKKFFLWLHYSDPHHPYHARSPWVERYTSPVLTQKLNFSEKKMSELKQSIPLFKKDPQTLFNLVALYDSEINFVDSSIGELIEKFELDKKTLIIVTADHGEEFLEHGKIDHGNSLYQESIHIPLIIKLPFTAAKKKVRTYANLVDVMPSILHSLDVDLPKQTRGKALLKKEGLLLGLPGTLLEDKSSDYSFSELDIRTVSKTIITPEWKYIYNYQDNTEELYTIKKDTLEVNNVARKHRKQCNTLKEQLFNWVSRAKKYPITTQPFLPSAEELEKLETLGYIE